MRPRKCKYLAACEFGQLDQLSPGKRLLPDIRRVVPGEQESHCFAVWGESLIPHAIGNLQVIERRPAVCRRNDELILNYCAACGLRHEVVFQFPIIRESKELERKVCLFGRP